MHVAVGNAMPKVIALLDTLASRYDINFVSVNFTSIVEKDWELQADVTSLYGTVVYSGDIDPSVLCEKIDRECYMWHEYGYFEKFHVYQENSNIVSFALTYEA